MLGSKHRASHTPGRCSTTKLHVRPPTFSKLFWDRIPPDCQNGLTLGILQPQPLELLEIQAYATGAWLSIVLLQPISPPCCPLGGPLLFPVIFPPSARLKCLVFKTTTKFPRSCNSPCITSSSEPFRGPSLTPSTCTWSPDPPASRSPVSICSQPPDKGIVSHLLEHRLRNEPTLSNFKRFVVRTKENQRTIEGSLTTLVIWIYQHNCSVHWDHFPSTKPRKAEVVFNQS